MIGAAIMGQGNTDMQSSTITTTMTTTDIGIVAIIVIIERESGCLLVRHWEVYSFCSGFDSFGLM
jgi:hypothetical protein